MIWCHVHAVKLMRCDVLDVWRFLEVTFWCFYIINSQDKKDIRERIMQLLRIVSAKISKQYLLQQATAVIS